MIVLRVLTKEDIQKLADRTREIRGKHHHSHYTILDEIYTAATVNNPTTLDSAANNSYASAPPPSTGAESSVKSKNDLRKAKRRAWTLNAVHGFLYYFNTR